MINDFSLFLLELQNAISALMDAEMNSAFQMIPLVVCAAWMKKDRVS